MNVYQKLGLCVIYSVFIVLINDVLNTDTFFKFMNIYLLFYIFLFKKEDL